jgi:hypothetical protein
MQPQLSLNRDRGVPSAHLYGLVVTVNEGRWRDHSVRVAAGPPPWRAVLVVRCPGCKRRVIDRGMNFSLLRD